MNLVFDVPSCALLLQIVSASTHSQEKISDSNGGKFCVFYWHISGLSLEQVNEIPILVKCYISQHW